MKKSDQTSEYTWVRSDSPLIFTIEKPYKPPGKWNVWIKKEFSMEYHYNLTFREYIYWQFYKLRYKIWRLRNPNIKWRF